MGRLEATLQRRMELARRTELQAETGRARAQVQAQAQAGGAEEQQQQQRCSRVRGSGSRAVDENDGGREGATERGGRCAID